MKKNTKHTGQPSPGNAGEQVSGQSQVRKSDQKKGPMPDHKLSGHAKEPMPDILNDDDRLNNDDRQEMHLLWELSSKMGSSGRHPDALQTGQALESVHKRIGRHNASENTKNISAIGLPALPASKMLWIAAAALILLTFGAGYLLYPVTVTAPNGQQVIASLPDGSTAELNSGTAIRYNRLFGYRNRHIQLNGEAFFTVVPGDKPFMVSANQAVVEVTGTTFNVRSRSDDPGLETRVFVASGSVALFPAGHADRKVTLDAGNWGRWNTGMDAPSTPEHTGNDEIAEWRENRFHFRNEPLGMILREVERRFDIRIQLDAASMDADLLTAHYSDPRDPERIIEDICHVKGLRYARTANGFRIYQ